MGDWVHSLAPWQVISHLTFSWEASIWSAQRCYEKFMRNEMRGVSYFYALEENPGRDGYHAHALWCDCKSKSRAMVWKNWFERYGRNRIEPVNSRDDVSDYCAKYICKEGAWWNIKLLSHRHPQSNILLQSPTSATWQTARSSQSKPPAAMATVAGLLSSISHPGQLSPVHFCPVKRKIRPVLCSW
jgi:hypothetical protein